MRRISILALLVVALTTCGSPATIAPPAEDTVAAIATTMGEAPSVSTPAPIDESAPATAPSATGEPESASTVTSLPAPPSVIDQRLVTADTRFGFKLLRHLVPAATGKNVFLSPTSIALALTLLHNGAAGSTREALAATLELEGMSAVEIDQANAQLLQLLRAPTPHVQLEVANAIWTQEGLALQPDFRTQSQTTYGAEIASVDFGSPATVASINRWVGEHTHGKIPTLFDRLDPGTLLVLANALYFKGTWLDPFDPHATHEFPFTLADGSTRPVPMMIRQGLYPYLQTETFEAVALPYKGYRTSMYIFVPRDPAGLSTFVQELTEARWGGWMEQFRETDKILWLPKFTLAYDVTLNQALTDLGTGIAFNLGRADFSRMVAGPLAVSVVKHKTFLEVNELGTEAAAVTGAAAAGGEPPPEAYMKVDRPFLLAIRDDVTDTILFLGAIGDPLAADGAS